MQTGFGEFNPSEQKQILYSEQKINKALKDCKPPPGGATNVHQSLMTSGMDAG